MTERSYVECTGSAIAALAAFRAAHAPAPLDGPIGRAIDAGVRFLRAAQQPDGGYAGFWGINFTYAAFHAVRGLRAAGVPADDPGLARAADWLVRVQRADGGWGEHYSGCVTDRYVEHPESQVVMTSWALLALMDVVGARAEAVQRGVAWLAAASRADGSWPPAGRQRSLLRHRDAGLPALPELLPDVGAGEIRGVRRLRRRHAPAQAGSRGTGRRPRPDDAGTSASITPVV